MWVVVPIEGGDPSIHPGIPFRGEVIGDAITTDVAKVSVQDGYFFA